MKIKSFSGVVIVMQRDQQAQVTNVRRVKQAFCDIYRYELFISGRHYHTFDYLDEREAAASQMQLKQLVQ